jgi:putative transposase
MGQPHPVYLALGNCEHSRLSAYRQLFVQQISAKLITDRRNALNTGLVLGNDRFRQEVEQLTGQRQRHLKRGTRPTKTRPFTEIILLIFTLN